MTISGSSSLISASSRIGPRLTRLLVASSIPAGVLFLIFCGWKFTFGLEHVLDLRLGDETKYLAYAIGHASQPASAEWSPFYIDLYRLEHFFVRDPISLYFFHQKLITVLLPICVFLFLMSRPIPFVLALASSVYLMISAANLPVGPKTLHLALAVMFLFLSMFIRLGQNPARWGLMLVASAVLSLIRPEFAIALAGFFLYLAYLIVTARTDRLWLSAYLVLGSMFAAGLYAYYGFPMYGGRTSFAFAQHFALNYSAWNHLGPDPWANDYHQIFNSVFHNAGSISGAFAANPVAFIHHLTSNLLLSPVILAGLFFGHFNFLFPRFKLYTIVEAGLLLTALLTYVAIHRAAQRPAIGRGSETGTGYFGRSMVLIGTVVTALPESICLIIFQIPSALMILVLYPRHHYVLAFGTILFVLTISILGHRIGNVKIGERTIVLLAALLIIVPSVGSSGGRLDATVGELSLVPRPELETAYFLRGLKVRSSVRVCGSETPGPGTYAGENFQSVSALDKHQGFGEFVASHDISIIVEDGRIRQDPAFSRDQEWQIFRAAPEKRGFSASVLPYSGIIVYVRLGLATAPDDSRK